MFVCRRPLAVFLALLAPILASAKEDLDSAARLNVRLAARQLVNAVELLQGDVVHSLAGRKERTLYRQADRVLSDLLAVERGAREGAARQRLDQDFDAADRKLADLLAGVRQVDAGLRHLQGSANRVEEAADLLRETLAGPGPGAGEQAVRRDAQALLTATRALRETVQYALADHPGRGRLAGDLEHLTAAEEQFRKNAAAGARREELRRDFTRVSQLWGQVVQGLRLLRAEENVFLLRQASRVDRLHERLFRRLGLEGKPPHLEARS